MSNNEEIAELEAQYEYLQNASEDSSAWNEATEKARERLEEAKEQTESTTETESLESQIAELERDYDRYNRAADSNAGNPGVYKDMADVVLEELVSLKTTQLEELAQKHDDIDHDDFIGAEQKKSRLYSEFSLLKAEVEELSAKVRDQ